MIDLLLTGVGNDYSPISFNVRELKTSFSTDGKTNAKMRGNNNNSKFGNVYRQIQVVALIIVIYRHIQLGN